MKIFLKKELAEKHIDLDAGDEIEFSGKVFSNALGDVWMDAENFTVIEKKEQQFGFFPFYKPVYIFFTLIFSIIEF